MIGRFYFCAAPGQSVLVVEPHAKSRVLEPRTDLVNHSPDDFSWGYEGSGPAQLALAILADATGDDQAALDHHQGFKRQWIAPLSRTRGWTIEARTARSFVQAAQM